MDVGVAVCGIHDTKRLFASAKCVSVPRYIGITAEVLLLTGSTMCPRCVPVVFLTPPMGGREEVENGNAAAVDLIID